MHGDQTTKAEDPDKQQGGPVDEGLRRGHEESQEAIGDLVDQVEAAERAEGKRPPSQENADETAATGI